METGTLEPPVGLNSKTISGERPSETAKVSPSSIWLPGVATMRPVARASWTVWQSGLHEPHAKMLLSSQVSSGRSVEPSPHWPPVSSMPVQVELQTVQKAWP